MNFEILLSKIKYLVIGIVLTCSMMLSANIVYSQEKETKKEIINPKREIFVVPAVTPSNKKDSTKTKPKVKSMSPELLDDPWEEKLEKRDSTIDAEEKVKNQENKAQEMKTDNKTEENKEKEVIKSDNDKKEENPKNNKSNKSTKKD